MALGGGIWLVQNKPLPGVYTNVTSKTGASAAISDRGALAMPLALDWGPEGEVFTVTGGDLQKNCRKLFGHDYTDPALLPLREIFKNATVLHTFRLTSGAVKASNVHAEARYGGTRGNDLTVAIAANVDDETAFDVTTYLAGSLVDAQTVKKADELKDNDFVIWKRTAALAAAAGLPLTGGANGTAGSGESHQAFLDAIEGYRFNVLGCPSDTAATVDLYCAFTRRMCEEAGANFQLVAYRAKADYEAVIGVENEASGWPEGVLGMGAYAAVYWTAGAEAGCAVNKSLLNRKYDGALTLDVRHTQAQLAEGLRTGKFMFHRVDGEVRVLDDINTLVTLSDEKGEVFQSNQTIRVKDQIANDVAVLFATRYLGTVPNDDAGRTSLWNDVCKILQQLNTIRAIEGFTTDAVRMAPGDTKKAVLCVLEGVNVVNVMGQLYMSAVIV